MIGHQPPISGFEQHVDLNGHDARYYDFQALADEKGMPATKKPILHFYGGNGFPVGVYQPLITELSRYFHVISLAMRGYWFDEPQDKVLTREQDADALIEFLEKTQSMPIIGIGHSQGATATAMAAAKRPDLFSALYFLDPVTFTKKQALLYSHVPKSILMTQEPFKSTQHKQADWSSIDAYYQHLRQNRAFRRISDAHLKIFAQNSLVPKANGEYTLLFKPEQELASYFGTPYITPALKQLNKLNVRYALILAKPSMFNSDKVRQSWKNIVPREQITLLKDYGHLVPMEAPEHCAKAIFTFESERQAK